MANGDDHLNYYREFFESFARTVNPDDQLPVNLAGYKLINVEVVGGIIDWTTQYLNQKKCPQHLMAPLIKIVIDEMRKACKKQPVLYGYNPTDNAYEPLKLMHSVMAKINEVCLRYLDNSMLCSLPSPVTPFFPTSVCAIKNIRRKMEDRHVVIHDMNMMFNIQEASPSSYYAVFDGHAGPDAAIYCSAHLHQFLAESKYFVTNPEQALYEAFSKTDSMFADKCKVENLSSGTTALVALLRPKERTLYVAWAGDSLALLVNRGKVLQIVNAHKPDRADEKRRIEEKGGCVILYGTWRVNGQLAVSRAIGDVLYKPYVIATPEIREIPLDGGEDFLILACDGLWDFVSEDCAARTVYNMVTEKPEDTDRISDRLVRLAKEQGSEDNVSVIVVFLKEPSKIAAEARWADRNRNMETTGFETNAGELPNNNPFATTNNTAQASNIMSQKADGLLLNLSDKFKMNGTDLSNVTNDDNLGPETDIDPPAYRSENDPKGEVAALLPKEQDVGDGTEGHFNPFMEHQEKAALEMERSLLQKKEEVEELSFDELKKKFDDEDPEEEEDEEVEERKVDGQKLARDETPTPPADAVHDVGGLEETAVDTESEDEWNYIKGELADDKENIAPQPKAEVADISAEDSNMSQLNPNAAEFVPVSPVSPTHKSPTHKMLLSDDLIAQSPTRAALELDINVPNQKDFEREVKLRPSEIVASLNNHNEEDSGKPTDLIENILNGKNIDDIPEFHPGSTPKKAAKEEFHFGPNAAPFTPVKLHDQSEAVSTRAVFGDESDATLGTTLGSNLDDVSILNKQNDPMSMSFYADKEDRNPFDLNEVQIVPDDIEEFLKEDEPAVERTVNNDDAIQTTDLDKRSYDDEKELASPLEPEKELLDEREGDEVVSKTPEPTHEDLLGEGFCCDNDKLVRSDVVRDLPEDVELISPVVTKEATEVADLLGTTLEDAAKEVESLPLEKVEDSVAQDAGRELPYTAPSPIQVLSETTVSPIPQIPKSPVPEMALSPLPDSTTSPIPDQLQAPLLEPQRDDVTPDITKELRSSPELFVEHSPIPPVAESPIPETSPSPIQVIASPDPETTASPNLQIPKSPVPDVALSPLPDSTASPIPDQLQTPLLEPQRGDVTPDFTEERLLDKAEEHFDELCRLDETAPVPLGELLKTSSSEPRSPYVIEQDHFRFSDAPPVSPARGEQIDVRTESIEPEFAVKAVVSPSEESRNDDLVEAVKGITLPPLEEPPVKIEDAQLKEKPEEKIVKPKATVAETATAKAKPPAKKTTMAKKPTSAKSTSAAATKVSPRAAPAPRPKAAVPRVDTVTKSATPRTSASPRAPSDKPSSATRTKPLLAANRTNEKKPITNGDVPSMASRTALAAKKEVAAKVSSKPSTLTSKVSSTVTQKPASARTVTAPKVPATTRPASKPSTTAKTTTTTTITTVKRPTTLGTNRTGAAPSTTKTTTSTSTKMSPRLAPIKPRVPSSTNAGPKVPPLAKTAPDAEKRIKERANEITASTNTSTRMPPTASARSVTGRRLDSKVSSTHTIVSKTTTTTMKSTTAKKPVEIVKNVSSKTKTTKIEKPQENGVSTVITEEIHAMIEGEPQLLKDNSPLDNKLVVESQIQTNTIAD